MYHVLLQNTAFMSRFTLHLGSLGCWIAFQIVLKIVIIPATKKMPWLFPLQLSMTPSSDPKTLSAQPEIAAQLSSAQLSSATDCTSAQLSHGLHLSNAVHFSIWAVQWSLNKRENAMRRVMSPDAHCVLGTCLILASTDSRVGLVESSSGT